MGAGLTCEAFIREDFQERKREKVNPVLAESVKRARLDACLSQEELAGLCSVKKVEISELESAASFYDPNLVNMIERATGIHIDRGRNKNKKRNKKKKPKKENAVW